MMVKPTNGHSPEEEEGANILQPTPGSVWRRARIEGYVVPLPSGRIAKLRPVALDQLLKAGKIPDMLTPITARSIWLETESSQIADEAELSKKFIELIDFIVPLAMLEPKVVEDPKKDDEISIDDIDFMDKLGIFNLATQPSEMLRNFRDQQNRRMVPALDGEDLRPETQ